jgi:hypothetical protein
MLPESVQFKSMTLRTYTRTGLLAVFGLLALTARAGENWNVVIGNDALTNQSTCLMESAGQEIFDGQGNTPIKFVYDGKVFYVVTKSSIDLSYPNVGLSVDARAPHSINRVLKEYSVVFDTEAEAIRNEFIRGAEARLALGFWPTWPKGATIVTQFSLYGFKAAYAKWQECQKTGEIK